MGVVLSNVIYSENPGSAIRFAIGIKVPFLPKMLFFKFTVLFFLALAFFSLPDSAHANIEDNCVSKVEEFMISKCGKCSTEDYQGWFDSESSLFLELIITFANL